MWEQGEDMGKEMLRVCDPKDCKTHEYVVSVFDRLEGLVSKLADGQHNLELNIVKLTENMDTVKRLHDRMDSMEITQETMKAMDSRMIKVEESEEKLKGFMWKLTGGIAVASAFLPKILSLIGL